MARRQNKTVSTLVYSIIGAFVIWIIGDAFEFGEEDSMTESLVDVLPAIVLALGVLRAFEFM